MMDARQMDPQMMAKLLAMFGIKPGEGMMPGMDPAMMGSAEAAYAPPPMQMDEAGRPVDSKGFPAYDEDVPNLPPSLKAAGDRRRRAMRKGGGKKR